MNPNTATSQRVPFCDTAGKDPTTLLTLVRQVALVPSRAESNSMSAVDAWLSGESANQGATEEQEGRDEAETPVAQVEAEPRAVVDFPNMRLGRRRFLAQVVRGGTRMVLEPMPQYLEPFVFCANHAQILGRAVGAVVAPITLAVIVWHLVPGWHDYFPVSTLFGLTFLGGLSAIFGFFMPTGLVAARAAWRATKKGVLAMAVKGT